MREAADLTGDVFVSVTRGLGNFRGDATALRRWVFTIAHHRMIDELRRTGRAHETLTWDVPEATVDGPSLGDEDLVRALATLTDEQRDVVVLRFVADLPIEHVAKIVGKRSGAVRML